MNLAQVGLTLEATLLRDLSILGDRLALWQPLLIKVSCLLYKKALIL
jgi:hypothetical protein